MKAASRGIRTLVPHVDLLATSPLERALQTAEIVSGVYGGLETSVLDDLAPDGERRAVLTWLQMQQEGTTAAAIGHEPCLGELASWLLASPESHFIEFKKGGACLLEWPSHVTAGDAQLRWLLTAGQVRKLGQAK